VVGRNYFVRQAATLLKLAQSTTNHQMAAALVEKAADLKTRVDEKYPPDASPPDVEREA
jgi:hypothetical protein